MTLSGCAASVYVEAQSFAGGLVAKVNAPDNGVAQVLIQNSYVAGHTGNQECLTELYPGTEGFNTAKGRYNIVSTRGLAGGLAAVLPEGSAVKRSYVTASVWSGGMHAPDEADVTAIVTKYGNLSMDDGVIGKKASDFSYCYTSSVVSGGENAGTVKGKQILEYSDPGSITVNSYFGELHEDTAEVFSARHLINLSFYNRDQFQITTVEQTDNILWRKDEDPDAPVLAETAPYCDELEERYPGVPVQVFHDYDSQGYTEAGSFKCIENPDLTLYNGNHYTIAGLDIGIQKHYKQQWCNASAFILSNTHLKVQDLNMKELQVKDNGTAAGILAFANGNSAKDTYVRLENIRIYGDDMCITATKGDPGDVGGAVASADVEELELDHVYVYGKNALISKIYGYNGKTVGGLIGHARIGKSMKIRQSFFQDFWMADMSVMQREVWSLTLRLPMTRTGRQKLRSQNAMLQAETSLMPKLKKQTR